MEIPHPPSVEQRNQPTPFIRLNGNQPHGASILMAFFCSLRDADGRLAHLASYRSSQVHTPPRRWHSRGSVASLPRDEYKDFKIYAFNKDGEPVAPGGCKVKS